MMSHGLRGLLTTLFRVNMSSFVVGSEPGMGNVSYLGGEIVRFNGTCGNHFMLRPLECEHLWSEIMDGAAGVSEINSTKNGLLMDLTLHGLFDQYLLSINPDVGVPLEAQLVHYANTAKDGYKISLFFLIGIDVDGKVPGPVCRDPNDPNRVSDELLRWHFRQSVLANTRGVGEPVLEADFPPGTDQMATLREEPYGKERFEMEVESRLRSVG